MTRKLPLLTVAVLIIIACILTAGCTTTTTATTTTTPSPVAVNTNGTVKNEAMNIIGLRSDGVDKFLGIPFAEPPVGDLRFAPPIAKEPWTETLDCTKARNASLQGRVFIGDDVPISEDCLYLNVWKPSNAKEGDKLPVYVWIHGGGWCYGLGSDTDCDGTPFARDGVIVVTLNYRLGALGYLALDTLMEEYGTAGNWATLDQICALQWVHDNIAKFGGDPDNVTIGGESAGSFNTFALIMSPKAEGLFNKAILESGTLTYILENQMRLDKAIEIGKNFAKQFGANDSKEGLEILRKADPMMLWNMSEININDFITGSKYQMYPVYDGSVLPLNEPYQALVNGIYNKNISVLIGNDGAEAVSFVNPDTLTEESFNAFIKKSFRKDSYQKVIDYYAAQTDRPLLEKACELLDMTLITLGVIEVENQFSKAGVPLYVYEFNYFDSYGLAPVHALEVPYAFGQEVNEVHLPFNGDDFKVRDIMHAYWKNFIKTGNPNGAGLLEWPKYVEGTKSIMELNTEPQLINRSFKELNDFLNPLYFR
ncbi:MAG TPA: carboxylesterase family protein [Methanocorpusculum sp.]|nr:carboxylesterase family protein [Methanocorpusculum sp.]